MEDVCPEDDRYDFESAPVGGVDNEFEDIEVEDHTEQDEVREDDVILHGVGIGFDGVFVFVFREHIGFVSVSEGLCEHHHDHSHFEACSIDAELCLCVGLVIEEGEEYSVESLVHDACDAEDK